LNEKSYEKAVFMRSLTHDDHKEPWSYIERLATAPTEFISNEVQCVKVSVSSQGRIFWAGQPDCLMELDWASQHGRKRKECLLNIDCPS
jgi:hypothetical protein